MTINAVQAETLRTALQHISDLAIAKGAVPKGYSPRDCSVKLCIDPEYITPDGIKVKVIAPGYECDTLIDVALTWEDLNLSVEEYKAKVARQEEKKALEHEILVHKTNISRRTSKVDIGSAAQAQLDTRTNLTPLERARLTVKALEGQEANEWVTTARELVKDLEKRLRSL
tara:strand:+ start:53973 stop:54485 length:513 start_codon:yes stop_codon:yes gene_type:complete